MQTKRPRGSWIFILRFLLGFYREVKEGVSSSYTEVDWTSKKSKGDLSQPRATEIPFHLFRFAMAPISRKRFRVSEITPDTLKKRSKEPVSESKEAEEFVAPRDTTFPASDSDTEDLGVLENQDPAISSDIDDEDASDIDEDASDIEQEDALADIDGEDSDIDMGQDADLIVDKLVDSENLSPYEARKKASKFYKPPTAEEIHELKETEELFKNNVFKWQIEELLNEAQLPYEKMSRLEKAFWSIKEVLEQVQEQPEAEVCRRRSGPPNVTTDTRSYRMSFRT